MLPNMPPDSKVVDLLGCTSALGAKFSPLNISATLLLCYSGIGLSYLALALKKLKADPEVSTGFGASSAYLGFPHV